MNEPGKQLREHVVTRDLDGSDVKLVSHRVVGEADGPKLTVLSAIHGSEWLSINVTRKLVESLNPDELRGMVEVVPVCNPPAFKYLTRCTRDESDSADLNRSFPGANDFLTEQLARTIVEQYLEGTDYLVVLDQGHWGWAIGEIMYGADLPDQQVVEASRGLALSFGYPCVRVGNLAVFPGPKSSSGYAGRDLGIPTITAEVGGVGFGEEREAKWCDVNVIGIMNCLRHVGMLDGEIRRMTDRVLLWKKRWRLNPKNAGWLEAVLGPDDLMREVRKGDVLGRVIDPYTFEEVETISAPGNGVVYYVSRSRPVRPGDWGYGLIDIDDADSRWEKV